MKKHALLLCLIFLTCVGANAQTRPSTLQVVPLTTVAQLHTTAAITAGTHATVDGFAEAGDKGGGSFFYDPSVAHSAHNGGTIIDPNKVFPSDWTATASQLAWFTPRAVATTGCWVRQYTGVANLAWFGGTPELTDSDFDNATILNFLASSSIPIEVNPTSYRLKTPIYNPDVSSFQIIGKLGAHHYSFWNFSTFTCDQEFIKTDSAINRGLTVHLKNLLILPHASSLSGVTSPYSAVYAGSRGIFYSMFDNVQFGRNTARFSTGVDLIGGGWFNTFRKCNFVTTYGISFLPHSVAYIAAYGAPSWSGEFNRNLFEDNAFTGGGFCFYVRDGTSGYGNSVTDCHSEGPTRLLSRSDSSTMQMDFIRVTSERLHRTSLGDGISYRDCTFDTIATTTAFFADSGGRVMDCTFGWTASATNGVVGAYRAEVSGCKIFRENVASGSIYRSSEASNQSAFIKNGNALEGTLINQEIYSRATIASPTSTVLFRLRNRTAGHSSFKLHLEMNSNNTVDYYSANFVVTVSGASHTPTLATKYDEFAVGRGASLTISLEPAGLDAVTGIYNVIEVRAIDTATSPLTWNTLTQVSGLSKYD